MGIYITTYYRVILGHPYQGVLMKLKNTLQAKAHSVQAPTLCYIFDGSQREAIHLNSVSDL